MLFDPESFKAEAKNLKCADHTLTIEELVDFGKRVTKLRSEFTERSKIFTIQEDQAESVESYDDNDIIVELSRSYSRKVKNGAYEVPTSGFEGRESHTVRKRLTMRQISPNTAAEIVSEAKEGNLAFKEIARKFMVKP